MPKVSIVVLGIGAPERTEGTLRTLSPDFQRRVAAEDYEVILVETSGEPCLGPEKAALAGANVEHVWAAANDPRAPIEIGLARCAGAFVGFFSGVGLATPRLVEHVVLAERLSPSPLVVVPVYDLGATPESTETPDEILARIDWRSDT